MPEHKVKKGECISSISKKYGLLPDTIWDDPANSELKQNRGESSILYPGDILTIPEKSLKVESGGAEQRHRFRKKGTPAKLRLRIMEEPDQERAEEEEPEPTRSTQGRDHISEDPEVPQTPVEDSPRPDVPYLLEIDGHSINGTTDSDGYIEATIPPDAKKGRLILNPGTPEEEEMPLNFGHLDPITEVVGVKERLANLSFECGDRKNEMTEGLGQAISEFQQKHGMEITGDLTDEVRQKILDVHGS